MSKTFLIEKQHLSIPGTNPPLKSKSSSGIPAQQIKRVNPSSVFSYKLTSYIVRTFFVCSVAYASIRLKPEESSLFLHLSKDKAEVIRFESKRLDPEIENGKSNILSLLTTIHGVQSVHRESSERQMDLEVIRLLLFIAAFLLN